MPPCATEAALGILADPMRNVNSFFQKKKNSLLKSAGGCAIIYKLSKSGGLAQLVRASASHAEGRRFESAALHQQRETGFVPASLCSKGRTQILSESHKGGFRLPVQKLADTLNFYVSRKAKMQASPPLSTNKKTSFVCRDKRGFLHCIAGTDYDI